MLMTINFELPPQPKEQLEQGQPIIHAVFNRGDERIASGSPDDQGNEASLAKAGLAGSRDILLAQLTPGRANQDRVVGERGLVVPMKMESTSAQAEFSSGPNYDPNFWNKNPLVANCYIYALNDYNPRYNSGSTPMNPGNYGDDGLDASKFGGRELQKYANIQIDGAIADGLHWTGNNSKPAPGSYTVALFVKPASERTDQESSFDFHWVRQDNNGLWSHKLGDKPVSNIDESGRTITDPRKARFSDLIFVGYFDVPAGGIKLNRPTDGFNPTQKEVPRGTTMKAPPMPAHRPAKY
jgi:hypothetical protein